VTASLISQSLIDAYATANYRVVEIEHEFVLRIGIVSEPLIALYKHNNVSRAAFITAWNPYSERRSVALNEAGQKDLRRNLLCLGCLVLAGLGEDSCGKWPSEPSFLALDLARDHATRLGHKFGQNAVVWATHDAIPRLVLLR
jgi:hypothetical protein